MKKLFEGGAVGHLQHLYDNLDLTFGEIKELLTSAAEGRLESVTEKLDGLNLVFSWDVSVNDLRVARNSGDIKNGGMNAQEIAAKFRNRGNLEDAFTNAFTVLRESLSALSNKLKTQIFGTNANIWYSMEIVYTLNPNVINYDGNTVIFHNWPVFEIKNGSISRKEDAKGVELLQKYIDHMQKAITVQSWSINGPAVLRLKSISNGTILQNVLNTISQIQSNSNTNDSNTIGDYLRFMLTSKLSKLNLTPQLMNDVVNRCLNVPGSSLNNIKKLAPKQQYHLISSFVNSSPDFLKKYIQPLEDAIASFSIEILKGLQSTLINDSDKEILRLRSEVNKATKAIETSNQDNAMEMLNRQMQKLKSLENISSTVEGVVFIYKGNAYKFTGAFAPVNQILGLFKYGRSGIKIPTVENHEIKMKNTKLRQLLSVLIKESLLLEKDIDIASEFNSNEEKAKKKWEDAIATLAAWDENNKKYLNLINKADELNVSIDTAKKRLKGNPEYALDPKMNLKKRSTLVDLLSDAQNEYAEFEPSVLNYSKKSKVKNKVVADPGVNSSDSEAGKNAMMPWEPGMFAMKWTSWPDNIKEVSGTGFGKQVDGERGEAMGTGPGEKWLAVCFGGRVMGGGVSYDVQMPNGDKCESKELESKTSLIRPGTEGLAGFDKARSHLENIMKQLREFINGVDLEKEKFQTLMSNEENQIINYIRSFILEEYENIVGKGEISRERIHYIRAVLKATKVLKDSHKTKNDVDPTVTLNKRTVKVKLPTYIDIAKKIEKDSPNEDILSDIETWDIILNTLKDEAFVNYSQFLNDFYNAVNPTEIFRQVDGMFIVNQTKGFYWIPKENLKEALRFEVVSQGKPKFRFVHF